MNVPHSTYCRSIRAAGMAKWREPPPPPPIPARCHRWVEFVIVSRLAPSRGFFLLQVLCRKTLDKNNISKFHFHLDRPPSVKVDVASSLNIAIV